MIPCPISNCVIMIVTVSSGAMRIQMLGANTRACASALERRPGKKKPIARPPGAVALTFRKFRRLRVVDLFISRLLPYPRSALDGAPDPLVRPAPADIARH